MDGHPVIRLLLQLLGALIMVAVLADMFLTVLYARVGTSVFSNSVARGMWRLFKYMSRFSPTRSGKVLSFCGPILLVALVGLWTAGLTLGTGLIIYPKLGTSVRAPAAEETPRDFVTALYAGGGSITVVGTGEYEPHSWPFKLFFMFNSMIGMVMISLTLTYFMQIYSALQRRNVATLTGNLATNETGDAAELIAGIAPEGNTQDTGARLTELASCMANVKETHHFYSLLMYFRFSEVDYGVTRLLQVMLDTVSLIKSALSDQHFGFIKKCAAVAELWHASTRLMTSGGDALLKGLPDTREPDEAARQRWRRRYFAALRRLRQAGLPTIENEQQGLENYISLRAQWDRYIGAYAKFMAYDMSEVDPICEQPEKAEQREEFSARLHTAG